MNDRLVIRGVPHVLAMDALWLDGDAPPGDGGGTLGQRRAGAPRRAIAIIVLVVLADLLFWQQGLGVSVAVFAFGVFVAAAWGRSPAIWIRPAAVLVAGALPVVDHLQALSALCLVASLIAALVWLHHPAARIAAVVRATALAAVRLPEKWLWPVTPRGIAAIRGQMQQAGRVEASLRDVVRGWAFPVGGSLVLLALLMQANPVLARMLQVDLVAEAALQRGLFWIGTALCVAPFLAAMPVPSDNPMARPSHRLPGIGLNAGSVLRALVMFNLLIAVQSLTDLSILTGGAALPAGMTLADYAHRGAYPLLATAILAGLFALAARPYLTRTGWTRPLMLLLIAQNVVLCAAAALRLELYIGAFGLTYTRLYALIWMALVAAGLGLTLWQIVWTRTTAWLMTRVAALGLLTLYLCSFVNMAQVVAAQNVTRAGPDLSYLCDLGPLAAGPIIDSGIGRVGGRYVIFDGCTLQVPTARDWREWGFRSWAVGRYVHRAAQEDDRR